MVFDTSELSFQCRNNAFAPDAVHSYTERNMIYIHRKRECYNNQVVHINSQLNYNHTRYDVDEKFS